MLCTHIQELGNIYQQVPSWYWKCPATLSVFVWCFVYWYAVLTAAFGCEGRRKNFGMKLSEFLRHVLASNTWAWLSNVAHMIPNTCSLLHRNKVFSLHLIRWKLPGYITKNAGEMLNVAVVIKRFSVMSHSVPSVLKQPPVLERQWVLFLLFLGTNMGYPF